MSVPETTDVLSGPIPTTGALVCVPGRQGGGLWALGEMRVRLERGNSCQYQREAQGLINPCIPFQKYISKMGRCSLAVATLEAFRK